MLKLVAYHLKDILVPPVVHEPQFENHWSRLRCFKKFSVGGVYFVQTFQRLKKKQREDCVTVYNDMLYTGAYTVGASLPAYPTVLRCLSRSVTC